MHKTTFLAALVIAVALLGFAVWSMAAGDRSGACPVEGAGCSVEKAECPMDKAACCPEDSACCAEGVKCCGEDSTCCAEGKDCCSVSKSCAEGKDCCSKAACPKEGATCDKDKKACEGKPAVDATISSGPVAKAVETASVSKKNSKTEDVRCPVMGGKIADVSKASKSVYNGKTYYFCCDPCKPKFDKNPENYVKPSA